MCVCVCASVCVRVCVFLIFFLVWRVGGCWRRELGAGVAMRTHVAPKMPGPTTQVRIQPHALHKRGNICF